VRLRRPLKCRKADQLSHARLDVGGCCPGTAQHSTAQHRTDGRRRHGDAQPGELALHAPVTPQGILAARRRINSHVSSGVGGRPARLRGGVGLWAISSRCQRGSVDGVTKKLPWRSLSSSLDKAASRPGRPAPASVGRAGVGVPRAGAAGPAVRHPSPRCLVLQLHFSPLAGSRRKSRRCPQAAGPT